MKTFERNEKRRFDHVGRLGSMALQTPPSSLNCRSGR